jgi:eukaryotic-like serine/threonine-protein kinase
LAPEQFRGASSSPATDLFAVGAILWEALVGRPMRNHGELVANRLGAAPLPAPVRRETPAALVQVLEALTAMAPEDRPATATEALNALRG